MRDRFMATLTNVHNAAAVEVTTTTKCTSDYSNNDNNNNRSQVSDNCHMRGLFHWRLFVEDMQHLFCMQSTILCGYRGEEGQIEDKEAAAATTSLLLHDILISKYLV